MVGTIEDEINYRVYVNDLTFPSIKKALWKAEIEERQKAIDLIYQKHPSDRADFTDKTIVSIDPPGCQDVDDALHFQRFDDHVEIGIHIADVSEWVQSQSSLDRY